MNARKRLLILVGIMVAVSLIVVLFAISLLYEAAFAEEESRLAEAVKSHARLIEAVARFDSVHSRDAHPDGWQAATLGQVIDAHNHDEGFGETGEFALARREGNRIIFLLKQRLSGSTVPEPVAFAGQLAKPMQLALSNKSGTTVGRDYRGKIVLAAHEPVALLNLGIVAKIDLSEIRAPFIRAGLVSGMVAVLVVVLGALLFFKISNPMIQRLEESVARTHAFLETALDGIIIMDHEGRITDFNPAAEKIFGYSKTEIIGRLLAETIIPPDLRERHNQGLARYLATGETSLLGQRIEISAVRADGGEFPIELTIARIGHSEPPQFTGFLRDISERKQAEARLQKLSSVVEQIADHVVVTNKDGVIEYVNPAFEKDSGYTKEEAIGKTPRILQSGKQDRRFYEKLWETILSGEVFQDVIINKRKDGTLYCEEKMITPLIDARGNTTHFVATGKDITERKRAEQELAEERDNLERTVKERTQELSRSLVQLKDANIRLEEANQHKTRFLSSMSHELRTPLNAVIGFADLLGGQHFGELNEKQVQYVSQIHESGRHLLALINDLLDIAKVDAGAMEVESQMLSLTEVVDAIVSMMDSQFRKKSLAVKTSVDPSIETFVADSRKLKQILLNLLSNAIKFTPEKGRIEVRVTRDNSGGARFEVKDTGIGIEADMQEYIFSEFRQAKPERDAHLGGTGIGLALSRRLVELHGGEIGVVSEPGKGSTFWFTLPPPEGVIEPTVTPAPTAVTRIFKSRRRRILVVEDNDVNLTLVLDMLSIHDHDVVVAKNGKEALDLVQSHKPDLVLMDMRMPVMDGYEATRQIRKLPDCADLPIVALTASVGNDAQERQIAAGCNAHLSKPIQTSELFKILDELLK